ncbi:MAG TPA: hypothetical protein VFJ19_02070 [Nocardioidaceae bacterium]|nr:hypothetical protein [Nocardioidaceae bacterium]
MPDGAVLVRSLFDAYPDGRVFDRAALIADSTVNFDTFGYYGLSLWAISEPWTLDRVLEQKARKAHRVAMFTAGELRSQGLGIVLSGKAPHVDTILGAAGRQAAGPMRLTGASAEELVDRFLRATYTLVENHLFEPDPG